jgi:hypothetical protein
MKPETILNYWCSPFNYMKFAEVKESDIYSDKMPIVFMGGRGTGKTMFLKYFSFIVQLQEALNKKDGKGSLLSHFKNKGGIGFYIRIDGPVLRSFDGHGVTPELWDSIFTHYFELVVGRAYIEVISELVGYSELDVREINNKFIPKIADILGKSKIEINTLSEVLNVFDDKIKEVTTFRGEVSYSDIVFKPSKGFASQSLCFTIPEIVKNTIKEFDHEIDFIIMIDEFENFLVSQQRMVNTLLKFIRSGITFRIGMRLEGFRTFETTSMDDFIKEGRDYRKIIFEEVLIKDKGYQEFLLDIAKKRLERVNIFKEKGFLKISNILGKSENLEEEAIKLAKINPDKHFNSLLKYLPSEEIEKLKSTENPLMEMLNILWVLRKGDPKVVNKAMNDYLEGKKTEDAKKYRRDYVDKYKLSLMFLFASIYRTNKMYYSFNTFSFLSSGIIGHFIELCRKSFQYAEFENREILFEQGKILPIQQDKASKDVANTELQMTQRIENYGDILYRFIKNIGNIFRDFHKDKTIKYPETNQFAVDKGSIEENYRNAFNTALKWSLIQKKTALQQPAPGKHIKDIYTINRIFAPIFEISYRTRGGYSVELSPADVKKLMTIADVKLNQKRYRPKVLDKNEDKDSKQQSFDF